MPGSIVLIGTYPPRRCGIATFTCDLHAAFRNDALDVTPLVVASSEDEAGQFDQEDVAFAIRRDDVEDYVAAGVRLRRAQVGVVCIQHEYGIFGGEAGRHILELIEQLSCPVVITLHTVLEDLSPEQREVVHALIDRVTAFVVMTSKARSLLESVYSAPPGRVHIIPHGAPDSLLLDTRVSKAAIGFSDRPLLLTFGLLSQNKGIEVVIKAMPDIVARITDTQYVVLGATHPKVRVREGEAYRDSLEALAEELGVAHAVRFENTFVDRSQLLAYLSAWDVYVTPYLTLAQITSGTLAYAVALGRPVVSTPYWHAAEVLADGRGVLAPFNDHVAIAEAVIALLADDAYRNAISRRAYASARGHDLGEGVAGISAPVCPPRGV